jgi:hypothetical protein
MATGMSGRWPRVGAVLTRRWVLIALTALVATFAAVGS